MKITTEKVKLAFSNFRKKSTLDYEKDYADDVDQINKIVYDTFGITLTSTEVVEFWKWYSDYFWCASWLSITEDIVVEGFTKFLNYAETGITYDSW